MLAQLPYRHERLVVLMGSLGRVEGNQFLGPISAENFIGTLHGNIKLAGNWVSLKDGVRIAGGVSLAAETVGRMEEPTLGVPSRL